MATMNLTNSAGAADPWQISSEAIVPHDDSAEQLAADRLYPWYCVQTKPHEERLAAINLKRQEFSIFLPYIKRRRMYRRKIQWVTTPMFSRYLFVQLQSLEPSATIRSTFGVANIVSFARRAAAVPYDVICEIRARCQGGVCLLAPDEFKQGDIVDIVAGPYQGMSAIFDRKTSDERRVVILLEIMESYAKAEIDRDMIARQK